MITCHSFLSTYALPMSLLGSRQFPLARTNRPPMSLCASSPARIQQQPHQPNSSATPLIFVIMGVSGCGKSTVGALLAAQLNCTFYDADNYHPAANVSECAMQWLWQLQLTTISRPTGPMHTLNALSWLQPVFDCMCLLVPRAGKMQAGIPLTDEDRWPWLERLRQLLAQHIAE